MVLRQQVWIDRNVQGALIGRVVLYWLAGMLYVSLGSACFQYYQHSDWSLSKHIQALFSQFWPWLPSAILCLPLILFDVVRLSNLFVGPIYRLRMHLAELNVDPQCRPLKFRDDDYWQDLVEPIHALQAELQLLRAEVGHLRQAAREAASKNDAGERSHELSEADIERIKHMLPSIGTALEPAHFSI
jgi:hypothetical protein